MAVKNTMQQNKRRDQKMNACPTLDCKGVGGKGHVPPREDPENDRWCLDLLRVHSVRHVYFSCCNSHFLTVSPFFTSHGILIISLVIQFIAL